MYSNPLRVSLLCLIALTLALPHTHAQYGVGDTSIQVTGFQFAYSPSLAMGHLAKKTGFFHSFSPGFSFKTRSNILVQFELNLLVANNTREDSVAAMIYSEVGMPISTEGLLEQVNPRWQGLSVHLQVGTLLLPSGHNTNSGLFGSLGLGYLQHRIHYDYKGEYVPQLEKPYVLGYDRFTNGLLLSQALAYRRYSNHNTINYQLALELGQGLTRNRRSWNYDLYGPDNRLRLDMYIGLKMGIILPFYGVSP
ncbi:MAG: hypothetical protein HYZ16_04455 [Bacteroidetes bacterium]|jgi:hypothetical protein|nr:hypothetical protein [Bacteroidota bacterium]